MELPCLKNFESPSNAMLPRSEMYPVPLSSSNGVICQFQPLIPLVKRPWGLSVPVNATIPHILPFAHMGRIESASKSKERGGIMLITWNRIEYQRSVYCIRKCRVVGVRWKRLGDSWGVPSACHYSHPGRGALAANKPVPCYS